uniref:AT21289p n=1 Tax=Drosophila melanogaster TaxID=7227 RepID=Q8T424_DROME|nr:AT21289p [Drosophila melanogaster]
MSFKRIGHPLAFNFNFWDIPRAWLKWSSPATNEKRIEMLAIVGNPQSEKSCG